MKLLLSRKNIEDTLVKDIHDKMATNGIFICSCRLESNPDSGEVSATLELCPGSKEKGCCKRGYNYIRNHETLTEDGNSVELVRDETFFEGDMEVDTMNILDEFDDPNFF